MFPDNRASQREEPPPHAHPTAPVASVKPIGLGSSRGGREAAYRLAWFPCPLRPLFPATPTFSMKEALCAEKEEGPLASRPPHSPKEEHLKVQVSTHVPPDSHISQHLSV